jgi:hypothetical protein
MSDEERKDKQIKCSDCGNDFVFTAGEQAHFASKGFVDPKRCRDCRAKRKQSQPPSGNRDGYVSRPFRNHDDRGY